MRSFEHLVLDLFRHPAEPTAGTTLSEPDAFGQRTVLGPAHGPRIVRAPDDDRPATPREWVVKW